jgi:NADH-quinone oxidoreductase subunit J
MGLCCFVHGYSNGPSRGRNALFEILFYVFSMLAVLSALSVVTRKNPIASAVSLVVCFFFLSALYALLDAHFVAVTQVLVYAGAIMVLFIFVIMLLNLRGESGTVVPSAAPRALAGVAAGGLVGTGVVFAIVQAKAAMASTASMNSAGAKGFGTIEQVGHEIFGGNYLLPFEVASVLLTVAVVGAVVLAKRDL